MKRIKCKTGEIWIRFESMEEYDKSKQILKDILKRYDDPDDRLNTCKVIVFILDEMKRSEWCSRCQAGAIEELKNTFGGENVEFVDNGTVNICDREFKDSENLERIADALEGIKGCLERIADCCECPEPLISSMQHSRKCEDEGEE